MLYLFTDFGTQGPYIGQMKSKVFELAHSCQVIDLMHDVPSYNVKAGAYLLAALSNHLAPDCVVVAVVDPKVGSDRKGLVLRADYRWFVGPDNGLFDVVAQQASCSHWYEINYQAVNTADKISHSFHGRDIFAPVGSKLMMDEPRDEFLTMIERPPQIFNTDDLNEIIYIDQFGSLMTGLRAASLGDATIRLGSHKLPRVRTFSDVPEGQPLFYENSQGLIEIAVNCGSAQELFSAKVGDPIKAVVNPQSKSLSQIVSPKVALST